MPLTVRTNGSGSSNIIQASWFNDYYNLLTGVMTDQPVTIAQSLTVKGNSLFVQNPSGVTKTSLNDDGTASFGGAVTLNSATVTNGLTSNGTHFASGGLNVSTIRDNTAGNSQITLASAGMSILKALQADLTIAGKLIPNSSITQINASVSGYAQVMTPIWGNGLKIVMMGFIGYKNGNTLSYSLPSSTTKMFFWWGNAGGTYTLQCWQGGTQQTITIISGLGGAGAGSITAQSSMHSMSMGVCEDNTDTLKISPDSSTNMNTLLVGIGY